MDAGGFGGTITEMTSTPLTHSTEHPVAHLAPGDFSDRLRQALAKRADGGSVALQLAVLGCSFDEIGLWWAARDADTYLSIISDAEDSLKRSALGFSKTVRWRAACLREPSHDQLLPLRDAATLELDKTQRQLRKDLEPYELYASCAIHAAKITTSYQDLSETSRWASKVSDGDGGRHPGHPLAERLERDLIESGWVWGAWSRQKPINTWADAVGYSLAEHSGRVGNVRVHAGGMPSLAFKGLSQMGYTTSVASDQANALALAEDLLSRA